MAFAVFALIVGQVSTALPLDGGADLVTVAAASPRPRDCIHGSRGAQSVTPWDLARYPGAERFCLSLARGYALLSTDPAGALAAAKRAAEALSGRPEPLVLEGRALRALSRFQEAHQRLAAARQMSKQSLAAPGALYDFAVAAHHVGHTDEALEAYRALVPRVALLDDGWTQQRVYVEAAALAMSQGPAGVDEAISYLKEARRRDSPPGFSDFVLGALALALDREGRGDEAAGVAADATGPWQLDRLSSAKPGCSNLLSRAPLMPPGEIDAVIAMLAERRDPELARQRWKAFLDARPNDPFAEHGRRKLARLTPGARRRK